MVMSTKKKLLKKLLKMFSQKETSILFQVKQFHIFKKTMSYFYILISLFVFVLGDILVKDEFGYLYFKDRTGETFR